MSAKDFILDKLAQSYDKQTIRYVKEAMTLINHELSPEWDENFGTYVVAHPMFPEDSDGDTVESALFNYWVCIANMLQARHEGFLNPLIEAGIQTDIAKKHGGRRTGAGRKSKGDRIRIYIPADLADWLKQEENLVKLRGIAFP